MGVSAAAKILAFSGTFCHKKAVKLLDHIKPLAVAVALGTLPAPALAQAGDSQESEEAGDGFEFVIPEAATALPGLVQQFAAERENARTGFAERQTEQAQIAEDFPDYPSPPLIYHQHWGVAGAAGRLLSLASEVYRYDGGAHGNTEFAARLWDTTEDHEVDFLYLFTDRYAAFSIIDNEYCRQLATLRAERGLETEDGGLWDACPPLHEQTVFPAGEEGRNFTRITVLVEPYVAGPYAVGTFQVDVPVTQALIALVRPEYRDGFALP
jgi:hypothetical protein